MHDFPVFMFGPMILYKSCVQLVFSMLGKDFTSELLKTWSLHLVGVSQNFTDSLDDWWLFWIMITIRTGASTPGRYSKGPPGSCWDDLGAENSVENSELKLISISNKGRWLLHGIPWHRDVSMIFPSIDPLMAWIMLLLYHVISPSPWHLMVNSPRLVAPSQQAWWRKACECRQQQHQKWKPAEQSGKSRAWTATMKRLFYPWLNTISW